MGPILLISLLSACAGGRTCADRPPMSGVTTRCSLEGDRHYDVRLPSASGPLPVLLYLHGGGGSAEGAPGTTAEDDDAESPDGLNALAEREGFIVVYAEGVHTPLARKLHTWNAGGGVGDWQCVSGHACSEGVDDVAYFGELLDDLESWAEVDTTRIYATGISNGGAMSYRLASAMPDRIAAIAPVASADQYDIALGQAPSRPVPILHVHGTEDPCWPWEGGKAACLQDDGKDKASVDATMALWASANGCEDASPVVTPLQDGADDGTTSTLEAWQGCEAELVLWRVEGGGHTWPDGYLYLKEQRIGRVERDVPGNEQIWAFLKTHSLSP